MKKAGNFTILVRVTVNLKPTDFKPIYHGWADCLRIMYEGGWMSQALIGWNYLLFYFHHPLGWDVHLFNGIGEQFCRQTQVLGGFVLKPVNFTEIVTSLSRITNKLARSRRVWARQKNQIVCIIHDRIALTVVNMLQSAILHFTNMIKKWVESEIT